MLSRSAKQAPSRKSLSLCRHDLRLGVSLTPALSYTSFIGNMAAGAGVARPVDLRRLRLVSDVREAMWSFVAA
jgi:hypothetical protein